MGYQIAYLLVYTKISPSFINFCKANDCQVPPLAASQRANRPPAPALALLAWGISGGWEGWRFKPHKKCWPIQLPKGALKWRFNLAAGKTQPDESASSKARVRSTGKFSLRTRQTSSKRFRRIGLYLRATGIYPQGKRWAVGVYRYWHVGGGCGASGLLSFEFQLLV